MKPVPLAAFLLAVSSANAADTGRLEYVPNRGQWNDPSVYHADLKGGRLFVEPKAATFVYLDPADLEALHNSHGKARGVVMNAHAYRIRFEGASTPATYFESGESSTLYSYFIGKDPARWAGGLHSYRSVTSKEIYPHIDLKYSADGEDFKCDWIVRTGGNASAISIRYEGVMPQLRDDGSILLPLTVGKAIEVKPFAWQESGSERRTVHCLYKVDADKVTFSFPEGYDHSLDLIIDPTLVFSSYTGSLADNWGFTATYANGGDAISGGNVNSFGYPVTTGAYQMTYGGGGIGGNAWSCDMAIAKYNSTGTSLLFATYLGGSDNEEPHSMVVDGNNNVLILGITFSSNYPVTSGAYDTTYNGNGDLVISKLSASGTSLLASTFIGGTGTDGTNISYDFYTQYSLKFNYGDESRGEIISDASSQYTIACVTQSTDFPVTTGVLQPSFGGGLQDGVLFRLDNNLSTLVWSTFFGGNNEDACYDIEEDPTGDYYIAGGTTSTNLAATPGAYQTSLRGSVDGFVLHINNNATSVLHCTYVGTNAVDQVYFVEQDRAGDVYVLGQTGGSYPISPGVYSVPNSGQFIQKFKPTLDSSRFSTTFGTGTPTPNICPTAFLIDTCQNIYVAGWGRCINFGGLFGPSSTHNLPVTQGAFQTTTDGCDFYFIILNANATSLLYATYFGGPLSEEHVDGGTSRFDPNGVIYESVCAGCGGHSDFPTQPGVVSQTNNSTNCNNAIIKFDLLLNSAQVVAQATPSNIGCAPFTVQFNGTISPGASGYYWDFGDGSPHIIQLNPVHTYAHSGIYTAGLYAFGTCRSDSVFLTIRADSMPSAAFTYEQTPCIAEVKYKNESTGATAYLWEFGDGDTSTAENPVHIYDSTGTYTVRMVSNPGGLCADTAFATLFYQAGDTSSVFIPNVFTPDGDGKNDVFRISGIHNCSDYRCKVYNRWGKKVFESTESDLFWDGNIGDGPAAPGVYYYIVLLDGHPYNGAVSLLRK